MQQWNVSVEKISFQNQMFETAVGENQMDVHTKAQFTLWNGGNNAVISYRKKQGKW